MPHFGVFECTSDAVVVVVVFIVVVVFVAFSKEFQDLGGGFVSQLFEDGPQDGAEFWNGGGVLPARA